MQATVLVGVKLPGRTLMATGIAGPDQHSRLFYVVDKKHTEVSVLPPSLSDQKHSPDKLTTAVDNTSITTYGKRSLTLNLGLRRSFPWIFIIADNIYLKLVSEFPALTQVCSPGSPVKHEVTHHIETTGSPVSARPRRLAPERLRVARQEFDHIKCMVITLAYGT